MLRRCKSWGVEPVEDGLSSDGRGSRGLQRYRVQLRICELAWESPKTMELGVGWLLTDCGDVGCQRKFSGAGGQTLRNPRPSGLLVEKVGIRHTNAAAPWLRGRGLRQPPGRPKIPFSTRAPSPHSARLQSLNRPRGSALYDSAHSPPAP